MSDWATAEWADLDEMNADVVDGDPTADIAIHYPANLDSAHSAKVTPDLMLDGFRKAKPIFAEAGVQLRLVTVRSGDLDPALFEVHSTLPGGGTPGPRFVDMYRGAERSPSQISEQAEAAFESTVGTWENEDMDRVVHLVVLQDVYMTFYEQLDFRTWQQKTISTGGLSFPGYMYGATMPRHLRGVISITDLTKDENSWKTVAHELGHKLMNVSHEYRETAPQHEVRADGGLMLYGQGTEIPSGPEGRFHRERLHRSPYVYRVEGFERIWNPDYAADGYYHDQIYAGISIDLASEAAG
jgi:hypothetical protein